MKGFIHSTLQMESVTVVSTAADDPKPEEKQEETLVMRLRPPPDGPRVTWAEGVIGIAFSFSHIKTGHSDNEHLGRLKSNCCCIYTRPRQWDDPSTWEQDEHETEHCRGHTLPPDQEKRLAGDKSPPHSPCC